jgi:hypothetical protein
MQLSSGRNLALIKKAHHDFNVLGDKILSVHDLSPLFMAYGEIYLRSLSSVNLINPNFLHEALINLYCLTNPGILKYMDNVECLIYKKDLISWDGIEPVMVKYIINIPVSNMEALIEEYPHVKLYKIHNDMASLECCFRMYAANSIGLVEMKSNLYKNYIKNFFESYSQDGSKPWLEGFYATMFEYFDNIIANINEINSEFVDFIDNGMTGMSIFLKKAYEFDDIDTALSSVDFIIKLKICKVIKIDTSDLKGIAANEHTSSIFFAKLIHTIDQHANSLCHFEINYQQGMKYPIFMSDDTCNRMLSIFSRCTLVLVRNKFNFNNNSWVINLNKFPKLQRFDMDNLNHLNKMIRIGCNLKDMKLISMTLNNHVSPLLFNNGLLFLDIKNVLFSNYIFKIMPVSLEVIDVMGNLNENITFNITKYPRLTRLFLDLNGNNKFKMTVFGTEPHSSLNRLKVSNDVVMGDMTLTVMDQMFISSSCIDQVTIDKLPFGIGDISLHGTVKGSPILDANKYPNLGIVRLMDGMHEKIHVKGNVSSLSDGIFLIK